MADDDIYQDQPETPSEPANGTQWEPPTAAAGEELPDRLRVHSLARVLGTTSRRVLDALSELDGRTRSAHSTVDRTDAVRVRDVLAQEPAPLGEAPEDAPAEPAPIAEVDETADVVADAEPESRLILETVAVEQSVYMPLFVAPQPVAATVADSDDEADDDEDEDLDADDADDDDEDADDIEHDLDDDFGDDPDDGIDFEHDESE